MMDEFESMWGGHIGGICVETHCIEVTSGEILPVHCKLYRPKSKVHDVEEKKIDRMLKSRVIELSETG